MHHLGYHYEGDPEDHIRIPFIYAAMPQYVLLRSARGSLRRLDACDRIHFRIEHNRNQSNYLAAAILRA